MVSKAFDLTLSTSVITAINPQRSLYTPKVLLDETVIITSGTILTKVLIPSTSSSIPLPKP